MITIRPEQVEALQESMRERFIAEAAVRLSARHAHLRAMPRDELKAMLHAAVLQAARHGLAGEHQQRFFELVAILGPSFDRDAWAQEILLHNELTPAEKLAALEARAP